MHFESRGFKLQNKSIVVRPFLQNYKIHKYFVLFKSYDKNELNDKTNGIQHRRCNNINRL